MAVISCPVRVTDRAPSQSATFPHLNSRSKTRKIPCCILCKIFRHSGKKLLQQLICFLSSDATHVAVIPTPSSFTLAKICSVPSNTSLSWIEAHRWFISSLCKISFLFSPAGSYHATGNILPQHSCRFPDHQSAYGNHTL